MNVTREARLSTHVQAVRQKFINKSTIKDAFSVGKLRKARLPSSINTIRHSLALLQHQGFTCPFFFKSAAQEILRQDRYKHKHGVPLCRNHVGRALRGPYKNENSPSFSTVQYRTCRTSVVILSSINQ